MILIRFIYIYIFLVLPLYAIVDSDLDGVEDKVDICPNTPFLETVDKDGCSSGYRGKIFLQVGVDVVDSQNLLNLYMAYQYKWYEISLSTSMNGINLNSMDNQDDDLFVTLSYLYSYEELHTKWGIGTKIYLDKKEKDNDYFLSLSVAYDIKEDWSILGYYSYTFFDTPNNSYKHKKHTSKDYHTLSIGIGYSISEKLYTSLAYNYISSYSRYQTDYKSISVYMAYMFKDDMYTSITYSYALDREDYDDVLSINIGVTFE